MVSREARAACKTGDPPPTPQNLHLKGRLRQEAAEVWRTLSRLRSPAQGPVGCQLHQEIKQSPRPPGPRSKFLPACQPNRWPDPALEKKRGTLGVLLLPGTPPPHLCWADGGAGSGWAARVSTWQGQAFTAMPSEPPRNECPLPGFKGLEQSPGAQGRAEAHSSVPVGARTNISMKRVCPCTLVQIQGHSKKGPVCEPQAL